MINYFNYIELNQWYSVAISSSKKLVVKTLLDTKICYPKRKFKDLKNTEL